MWVAADAVCVCVAADAPVPGRVGLLCACDGQSWESHLRRVLQLHQRRTSNSTSTSNGTSSTSSSRLTVFNCSLPQLERDLNSNVMPSIANADLQVMKSHELICFPEVRHF